MTTVIDNLTYTLNSTEATLTGTTYTSSLQTEVNISVESLQLGDLVKTYLHGYQPVCRIGSARGTNNSINPDKVLNCLHTMKQTDGMTHDLTLVGGHSILVDTLHKFSFSRLN